MNINLSFKLRLIVALFFSNAVVFAAPVFTPGSQPTGWLARPETSSFDLSSGNEVFYQVDYSPDTFSGDTRANDINNIALVQTTGPWDNLDPTLTTASTLLDLRVAGTGYDNNRKIVTLEGSNKVAFRWDNLSGAQQTSIGDEKILNFIRGDRSNEEPNGESYYGREHVMGDAMHSSPFYMAHIGGEKRVYAGTNDGMLHVFDAATGAEVFAYIPSMVIPNLNKLTNKPFVHTYFVDGPISVANVSISGTVKTILVGGLGAGGKGLYALDVTAPSAATEAAAASKIKWEITATGSFSDLGHTYGTPKIARLNNGTAVAIIGNGYTNSGTGHAVLYIINLDTGAFVNAIDTGSGSAASPNGLSTPTLVDTNKDGKVEYAYAGDIDGNLWKFDLVGNTSSLVFTTSPAQAITVAPVVFPHPHGGTIVAFATGRMLSTGDKVDLSAHYAYGIWDGAPTANDLLLTQTLTADTFTITNPDLSTESIPVRTITANVPNWSDGTGNHYGWQVALPPGERTIGEAPFFNDLRYYFLSTNPTVSNPFPPDGANYLNEFNIFTGGAPAGPIFDLNLDGGFDSNDLASTCTVDTSNLINCVPVSRYLGSGVFSQPILVNAYGFTTTLFAFHPDLPSDDSGNIITPPDPGVSGGHFDFDIYYYGNITTTTVSSPTNNSKTGTICKKTSDIEKDYNEVTTRICNDDAGFSQNFVFLTAYSRGGTCDKIEGDANKQKYYQTVTCNSITTSEVTSGDYLKKKHEHEYDDKYDVTGVNMLNASVPDFNLPNAITDPKTPFKILVMNQYLNPAAKLSVGGANYENVKTYGNLASETNATTLLDGLSTYTRNNIDTFIYNLPLDAFLSKDWWGDGNGIRAGLIPTVTGCVNKVDTDGIPESPGLNSERFNGALTIQLIKSDTPASALELNHDGIDIGNGSLTTSERVKYGWRVKQADFKTHVLAEYTSFWHHDNGLCYDDAGWVADAPQDFSSAATSKTRAAGSADPTDGIFSAGLAVTSTITTVNGDTTETVITYSDNSTYTHTAVTNVSDSTTTITQVFRDGTSDVTTIRDSSVATKAGYIDPSKGSPQEQSKTGQTGRVTWQELFN